MNQKMKSDPNTLMSRGFWDLLGIKLVEVNADWAEMAIDVEPKHLNSQGSLHGGVLAALIDISGGVAGCYCPRTHSTRKAVTLSLTTSFIAPATAGAVRAVGRTRSAGRNIFTSSVDVFDATGKLIAIGEGTYRYFNAPA